MNPRTTQLLAILAVILTFFAYRSIRDARPTYVVGLQSPLNFSVPAVQSFEIRRNQGDLIRIVQKTSGEMNSWQIVEPVVDPGRYSSIEDLLLLLRDVESYGSGPQDLRLCGLDNPRISVSIETGSSTHQLDLGNDHASLNRVHALIDGQSLLIDRGVRDVLEQFQLSELREDAVVGISPERIQSLQLVRAGQADLILERKGPFWWMEKPYQGDANSSAVEAWLQKLSQWAVIDYLDDSTEVMASPRAILTLKTEDREKTVTVGPVFAVEGQSTAVAVSTSQRSAVLIAAGSTAENLVNRSAARLVSPYLVRLNDPRIDRLSLSSGSYGPVEIRRSESGGWKLKWAGEKIEREASESVVEAWLTDLRTLRSESWQKVDRTALQKWGFDQPLLEIRLHSPAGESEDLIVGTAVVDQPGLHYVWNPRREACALVPLPILDSLRQAPFSVRSLRLGSSAGEVLRLRLSAPGLGPMELVCPNQVWRLVGGGEEASSMETVQLELKVLAERMLQLAVGRWFDPAEIAPDESRYRVRIDWLPVEAGDLPLRTVYLGGRTEEGWLRARLGDSSWGFAVAPVAGVDLESVALEVMQRLTPNDEEGR